MELSDSEIDKEEILLRLPIEAADQLSPEDVIVKIAVNHFTYPLYGTTL